MKPDFPELRRSFAAYFNQDWDADYKDELAVLAAFSAESPEESVRSTITEIRAVIALPLDDHALKRFVQHDIGISFEPQGISMREWLDDVAAYLNRRIVKPGA